MNLHVAPSAREGREGLPITALTRACGARTHTLQRDGLSLRSLTKATGPYRGTPHTGAKRLLPALVHPFPVR